MSLLKRITTGLACLALLGLTGCVGPMACGPGGGCGPLAFNSCGGCGDCQGCGELYIDPWISDPPNCHDPCDQCGNFNGQSCGRCRSVFEGFASLWGYRYDSGCDACGSGSCGGGCSPMPSGGLLGGGGGCDSCGSCDSCSGMAAMSQDPIQISSDRMPPSVHVQSVPSGTYQPSRTRQIFKPRGNVASGSPRNGEY